MIGSQGSKEGLLVHIQRVEVGKRSQGKWKIKQTIVLLPLPLGPGLGFSQHAARHIQSGTRAHTQIHNELFIYFLCEG